MRAWPPPGRSNSNGWPVLPPLGVPTITPRFMSLKVAAVSSAAENVAGPISSATGPANFGTDGSSSLPSGNCCQPVPRPCDCVYPLSVRTRCAIWGKGSMPKAERIAWPNQVLPPPLRRRSRMNPLAFPSSSRCCSSSLVAASLSNCVVVSTAMPSGRNSKDSSGGVGTAVQPLRATVTSRRWPCASRSVTRTGRRASPASSMYLNVRSSRSCGVEALWYGATNRAA